jgi:hypothetical protein
MVKCKTFSQAALISRNGIRCETCVLVYVFIKLNKHYISQLIILFYEFLVCYRNRRLEESCP